MSVIAVGVVKAFGFDGRTCASPDIQYSRFRRAAFTDCAGGFFLT